MISSLNTVMVWIALIAVFRLPARRKYSAMALYLGVDALLGVPINVLLYLRVEPQTWQYNAYMYMFWTDYLVQAFAVFFVAQQIFGDALSPLAGLRRLGLIIFRWIAVTSVVFTLASAAFPLDARVKHFDNVMVQIVRCASLMEIGLLVFLALTVHSLGLSFRSRTFGIGLGFGMSASADLIVSAIFQYQPMLYGYANLFGVCTSWLAITTWALYFLKKEPARQPVTLPVTSPLLRWNEIANALGHKGGQVVLGQPAFFLQDVEKVVDRVLTKNAVNEPRVG